MKFVVACIMDIVDDTHSAEYLLYQPAARYMHYVLFANLLLYKSALPHH